MRRKTDMWQGVRERSFLPPEGEQAVLAALADAHERIERLEEQLRSQFTSMAAYAQIAQQSIDIARAEARADLEREKATLVSLVERAREEWLSATGSGQPARPPSATDAVTSTNDEVADVLRSAEHDRIERLEGHMSVLSQQFAQCLRSQEDLANSIALVFEQQLRRRD